MIQLNCLEPVVYPKRGYAGRRGLSDRITDMYSNCRVILILILIMSAGGCAGPGRDPGLPVTEVTANGYKAFEPEPAAGPAGIEPVDVLSFEEALDRALMFNPELRAFSWNVRAAGARALQASLWSNPEVEIEFDEVGGRGGLSGFEGAEVAFLLSHRIELGGKRGRRTEAACLESEAAARSFEAKRLSVYAEVVKRFAGALAAQEYLRLNRELLDVAEEMSEIVARRVEAGRDAELEKTRAEVVLSNMRIREKAAVRELRLARKRLSAMWGSSECRFDGVDGDLAELLPAPPLEDLAPLLDNNPLIVMAGLEHHRRKALLNLERALAIPDITVSGGIKRFNETGTDLWVLGFSVPIPLFNRNQGGRLAAAAELDRAREELGAARSRLTLELEEARSVLAGSYEEAVELREKVLAGAQKVYLAAGKSYRRGKTDYLNVLDAQRTMFQIRKRYIEILSEYHSARADLERITGGPLDPVKPVSEGEKR